MLWLYLCKIHRRSFGNINEAKQISLEDALSSKEIHAAFISTENKSHEEAIRYFVLLFLLFSLASTFHVNLGAQRVNVKLLQENTWTPEERQKPEVMTVTSLKYHISHVMGS